MDVARPLPMLRRAALALAVLLAGAAAAAADPIAVKVEKTGQRVVVDVVLHADAPVAQAWTVFTDYEAMPGFLKSVTQSKVLKREGNSVTVEQAGAVRIAFMRFAFHAVRSVELTPMREIRSGQLSGDFKEYASTTTFTPTEHGVRIHHHGSYVPKSWIPPLIGTALIEAETRRQYEQFLAEIDRREGGHKPAARPPS